MTKRLVIAIDCDDVLIITSPHLVDYYNKTYGTALELHHLYNAAELKAWGTDKDEVAIGRVQDFTRTDEHAAIRPDPEAVAAVKELAARHELHLVTGRADFLEPITLQMCETYFPDCFQTIEHTNYLNPSADETLRRTKGEVCAAIGADILIDDHIKHGESALGTTVNRAILFGDFPWSKCEVLPEGMVRCVNWEAVVKEIESYAAGQ